MPVKVLCLTKYGGLAASTRHRYLQYVPHLRDSGIEAVISPLIDDDTLRASFAGRRPKRAYLAALARRLLVVLGAARYDAVVVHCEIFPYLPPVLESYLRLAGVPYVYDFDDAIFHQYDCHPNTAIRRVLGQKIRRVIGGATAVVA